LIQIKFREQRLNATARQVIWLLLEQLQFGLVQIFYGLQWRLATEG
jgi:hypothetical protein